MARIYKSDIIEKHYWLSNHSSGYILYGLYNEIQAKHKRENLNPELYKPFGIQKNQKTALFDIYKAYGYYDNILLSFIFMFGKNIESFFEEYLKNKVPDIQTILKKPQMKGNVYQRLEDVSKILKEINIDITKDPDYSNIMRFMQIRHIFMHNDGKVDRKFRQKINTKLNEGDLYPLDERELSKMYESFRKILNKLDKNTTAK